MKTTVSMILGEYEAYFNAVNSLEELGGVNTCLEESQIILDCWTKLESLKPMIESRLLMRFRTIVEKSKNEIGCLRDALEVGQEFDGILISNFIGGYLRNWGPVENFAIIASGIACRIANGVSDDPEEVEWAATHLDYWYDILQSEEALSPSLLESIIPAFSILPRNSENEVEYVDHIIKAISVLCRIGTEDAKWCLEKHLNHESPRVAAQCRHALIHCFGGNRSD